MKFQNGSNNSFYTGLKMEVDQYLTSKTSGKYGTAAIVVKGIISVLVYCLCYAFILSAGTTPATLLIAYMTMGISGVMIVFNIVHDASHNAVSKKKWVNRSLAYLGDMVGINTYIWNIRHNIQHHTFTNVVGGDLIIDQIPLIRLSPHQPYKSFHRYQPYYAILLYMFYSFYWMFVIDINLFFKKDICNLHNIQHPAKEWIKLIMFKLFYVIYMLILPWYFTSLSFLSVVGYFFLMHFTAGILLSFIAVLGHFVEGSSFPEPVDDVIQNSWIEHELEATIDFAPRSRIVNWITGGLNTHVAHHLFPDICHVHYYDITTIIAAYCQKHNYDYKKESFFTGLQSHFRYIKQLSIQ